MYTSKIITIDIEVFLLKIFPFTLNVLKDVSGGCINSLYGEFVKKVTRDDFPSNTGV